MLNAAKGYRNVYNLKFDIIKCTEHCPGSLISKFYHARKHNSHFILIASENRVCRSALNSFYMSSKDNTKKRQGQYKKGKLEVSLKYRCRSSK